MILKIFNKGEKRYHNQRKDAQWLKRYFLIRLFVPAVLFFYFCRMLYYSVILVFEKKKFYRERLKTDLPQKFWQHRSDHISLCDNKIIYKILLILRKLLESKVDVSLYSNKIIYKKLLILIFENLWKVNMKVYLCLERILMNIKSQMRIIYLMCSFYI